MNEEIKNDQNKTFPWGALAIYIVVALITGAIQFYTIDSMVASEGMETDAIAAFGVIGIIIGAIVVVISAAIEYAFTKFPTQWISKEEHVYKFDIWSAIFYSGAISSVITLIVQQLGLNTNVIATILNSIISTALFLFFYFSGQEKEAHIKRAITIVQVVWLVIGIILTIASQVLLTDMPV